MHRLIRVAFAILAIAATRTVAAQGTVTGKWIFEFNRRVMEENGERSESDLAQVRLTLDVQGDSVIGNWQLISADGTPVTAPQRRVHGHALNGKFRVETEPNESVMRDNSGEHTVKTTTVLEFTVSGDELSGTRAVLGADGSRAGEARPFKAVREKA